MTPTTVPSGRSPTSALGRRAELWAGRTSAEPVLTLTFLLQNSLIAAISNSQLINQLMDVYKLTNKPVRVGVQLLYYLSNQARWWINNQAIRFKSTYIIFMIVLLINKYFSRHEINIHIDNHSKISVASKWNKKINYSIISKSFDIRKENFEFGYFKYNNIG